MSFYPQIGPGTVAQFPVARTRKWRVITSVLESGERIVLPDTSARPDRMGPLLRRSQRCGNGARQRPFHGFPGRVCVLHLYRSTGESARLE